MTWKIFFIMWVSWAWKWTLVENLKKQTKIKFDFIKSYVTREIRPWEIDGNIYHFISMDEFKKSIEKGEFIEYKFVHNLNYYWTKKKELIEDWIEKWKNLIKEIEIEWLKDIFKNHPELKAHIKTIFLEISKETYKKRIIARQWQVDEIELENRAISLEKEKKEAQIYCDFILNTENSTKEETLNKVLDFINSNI